MSKTLGQIACEAYNAPRGRCLTAARWELAAQAVAYVVRDAAVADAERYRWLRDNCVREKNLGDKYIEFHCDFESWNDVDAAIDATRAREQKP